MTYDALIDRLVAAWLHDRDEMGPIQEELASLGPQEREELIAYIESERGVTEEDSAAASQKMPDAFWEWVLSAIRSSQKKQ